MRVRHDVTGEEREIDAAGWKELVKESTDGQEGVYRVHHWTIVNVGPAEILPHHSDREIEKRWRAKWDAREREYAVEIASLLGEGRRNHDLATSVLYAIIGHNRLKVMPTERAADTLREALGVHLETRGDFVGAVKAVVTLRKLWRKGYGPQEEGEEDDGLEEYEPSDWWY